MAESVEPSPWEIFTSGLKTGAKNQDVLRIITNTMFNFMRNMFLFFDSDL